MSGKETSAVGRARFELSEDEFFTLAALVEKQVGIHFPREKIREFQMKLEKLPESQFPASPHELIAAAAISDEVLGRIVNALTVGESYFFRNRPHFAALRSNIIPDLIRKAEERKSLSIWSAGCATGEEPYSIAMLLADKFPYLKDWDVSIVATDINTDFLTKARAGVYRQWSLRGVEPQILNRHFHEDREGNFSLHENIKRMVSFRRFNLADLLEGARPIPGNIDLVLCRNVLIYFPFRTGDNIISVILEMVRRGGYLLVGHSESFPSLGNFEVIHAHATYYYRRYINEQTALLSMPAQETAAIPGLAVRTTCLPSPLRASLFPSPERKGQAALPSPELGIEEKLAKAQELANSGRTTETMGFLSELSEKEGRLDFRVHFLYALISDHAGYVLKAIESLKRAIFLNKSFVVGHYYLGVIYQREGEENVAKRHFKNVLRLLDTLSDEQELEEAEGLTAGRLKEIVKSIFEEISIE